MNLFLDPHVLLWWRGDSPALSQSVRDAIAAPDNLIVVSSVVIGEVRIKQALGKLEISPAFFDVIKKQDFEFLSVTPAHARAGGDLPMHHRDPFDRMIITQAKREGLSVVTHDAIFIKSTMYRLLQSE